MKQNSSDKPINIQNVYSLKKGIFMKFLLLLAAVFSLLVLRPVLSQELTSTTMQDIVEAATKKVAELENQRNQEVVNMTFDLLVNQGKKTIWRYLDPAFDYDVIVLGDRRVKSLKLSVYKKNNQTGEWSFVDEYSAENPQLRLDPAEFEQYEFTVTADQFRPGDATCHFAFILYHQNPERNR